MGAFNASAQAAETQAPDGGSTPPAPSEAAPPPGGGAAPPAPSGAGPQARNDALGLRAPAHAADGMGGQPLAINAPRALSDPEALFSALAPLMVRNPRPPFELDIEATVEALARFGPMLAPQARPGERRWLRAVLIHETGPQTPIWTPTLRELATLLKRRGAFRSLWRHELSVDEAGAPTLRDAVTRRSQGAQQAQWHRDEVIVVASDFVSAPWWQGVYPACVQAWREQHHVLLLHLLPRRLWTRSWTGAADLRLSGQIPGGSSATLYASPAPQRAGLPSRAPRRPGPPPLATAIVPIEAAAIARWAAVVVAAPAVADGLHLGRRLQMLATLPTPPAGAGDARQRVEAFRGRAAPTAIQLARYLAVTAPLTLPMMQWVQAALLPGSDAGHLAEFFLGGLLEVAWPAAPEATVYDLRPEVRRLLAQGMPMSEAIGVIRAVGARLARAHGYAGDVLAMVSAGAIGELSQEASELRLFAEVSRDFLIAAGRMPPLSAAPGPAAADRTDLLVACQRLTLLGENGVPECGVVVAPRLVASASAELGHAPYVSGNHGRTLERVPGQRDRVVTLWRLVDGPPFEVVMPLDITPWDDGLLQGHIAVPADGRWAWQEARQVEAHETRSESRMLAVQGVADDLRLFGAPFVRDAGLAGLVVGSLGEGRPDVLWQVIHASALAQAMSSIEPEADPVAGDDLPGPGFGSSQVDCAALSRSGHQLLVAYRGQNGPEVGVWPLSLQQPGISARTLPAPWRKAALGAGGRTVYAIDDTGRLLALREDGSLDELRFADGSPSAWHVAAHPHDGAAILVCNDEGVHLLVHDRPDPDWGRAEGYAGGMLAEFSPDGEHVVTLSHSELVLCSLRGRRRRWSLPNDRRPVVLAFDETGRRVLACSQGEGTLVQVADVASGELLGHWWAQEPWITCAAFLPGGDNLLLANGHGLTLVDATTGRKIDSILRRDAAWFALIDEGRRVAFHGTGSPVRVLPLAELLVAAQAEPAVELPVRGRPEQPQQTPMPLQGHASAHVKESARTDGSASAGPVRLSATPGEDVVVMEVADGPQLVLHPDAAQQMVMAPQQAKSGFLGGLLMSAVSVVTGLSGDADASLLASEAVQRIDGQVDPGVYRLQAEALSPLKGSGGRLASLPPSRGLQLVLMHGELVDTAATFGGLWSSHPQRVRQLFDAYAGEVYAHEHATLGESPIGNALQLARTCASGARLHLLAHSRGGLVAEVLARACSERPLNDADLQALQALPHDREALLELSRLARERSLRVERIVRVGCPAAGTALLSKRLDAFLSMAAWLLKAAGVGIAANLIDLAAQVARQRDAAATLPGLAALQPESPFIAWLNTGSEPIEGELRIVAGAVTGGGIVSRLSVLLTESFFFGGDSDLVVQTESMFGALPRQPGASLAFVDRGSEVNHFNYFKNSYSAQAVVDALLVAAPAGFAPVESRIRAATQTR